MKKYFSLFALFIALPSLYYSYWYVTDQVSAYSYCKEYATAHPELSYYTCNSLSHYLPIVPILWPVVVFVIIYSFALFITQKIENKTKRIFGLIVLWLLFLSFLGFDFMVYGLAQALH